MKAIYYYPFPPQNYLEEEILLGAILINPSIFPHITPLIKSDSFFLEKHQVIYENLLNIHKHNKLNPVQLLYYLSNTENLILIGGIEKIIELMKQSQIFTSSTKINKYAEELITSINQNYIKRLMIQYGYNIIRLAYVKKFPSHQLYNRASNYLNFTSSKIPKENMKEFKDLVGDFILQLKNKSNKQYKKKELKPSKTSIISGFESLDKLTYGLPNGDLIVIAGRPSMGKTSLAINIVNNILNNLNIGICIFSLEMSKMQILQKLISIASQISTQDLTLNNINKYQWNNLKAICCKLVKTKIYLNDTANMSIDYIEYTSKLLHKETLYVEIIIIDYLQLIQVEEYDYETRTQELSYITRKLKLLAQNLNVPLIILSQLNRSIENRVNKKPILSDLRESGCINTINLLDIDYINYINISNIFRYQNKLYRTVNLQKKTSYILLYLRNKEINLHILFQYIFMMQINHIIKIQITYNHKIYNKNLWFRQYDLLDNSFILKEVEFYINKQMLENLYIQNINCIQYTKVYDIKTTNNLYFKNLTIIVHNSIEQDADIVLMLYKKEKEINQSSLTLPTTIDLFLCKNRNGPTGCFQLLFSLNNTTFTNLQNPNLINHIEEYD
uniref:DNA 5'-3' helicase n=1 Tax=Sebdenia flabellata TaxID=42024 RepID=A0A1C9CA37_9FLOR|nr:replication helicase subunit [Sebdenia flabellata]AOM65250.1 replication helicase subunit [Sebdenia flabellata]